MSDGERHAGAVDRAVRALGQEDRARAVLALHQGGRCAGCGRALADGEPVWLERRAVDAGGTSHWWVPVADECVAEATRRKPTSAASQPCPGCGRGVYRGGYPARGRPVACSEPCRRGRRAAAMGGQR